MSESITASLTTNTEEITFNFVDNTEEITVSLNELARGANGAPGASGTTVSITPPTDPEVGQFWYDPEDAVMSFWTGSEWVTEEVAITSGETSAFANALIFA